MNREIDFGFDFDSFVSCDAKLCEGVSDTCLLNAGAESGKLYFSSRALCEHFLLLYELVLSTFGQYCMGRGVFLLLFAWVSRAVCKDMFVFAWVLRGAT